MAWGYKSKYELIITLAVTGIMAAASAIALVLALRTVNSRERTSRSTPNIEAVALSADQRQALLEVSKFFGKDEMALRGEVDLHGMLTSNILVQVTRYKYIRQGRQSEFFYNNFTARGGMLFWAKQGKYTVTLTGVQSQNETDQDVLILIQTEQYCEGMDKLNSFVNSAFLPNTLKHDVRGFIGLVNQDTDIMFRVLDERRHDDIRYFTKASEANTPFARVIENDFAARAVNLKPQADKIMSEVTMLLAPKAG